MTDGRGLRADKVAKINRLKWRSKRSILELDLYFDKFIHGGGLEQLTQAELDTYTSILDFYDSDLLLLLQNKVTADNHEVQQIIAKISAS